MQRQVKGRAPFHLREALQVGLLWLTRSTCVSIGAQEAPDHIDVTGRARPAQRRAPPTVNLIYRRVAREQQLHARRRTRPRGMEER